MKRLFEEYKDVIKKAGCLALVVMIAGTGIVAYHNSSRSEIPELVTFVDPETAQVEEDEVPLASGTKTTRKVSTKLTTKKTTMPTKAKKTRTTTTKTTNNSTKTTSSDVQRVKTNTQVATTIKTKTKKNSKVKTTQTKVVTTVTTTTTKLANSASAKNTAEQKKNTSSAPSTYNVRNVASAADGRVLSAFESMGFKVVVNPAVSYSGCFDAKNRTITLRKLDSTVYHELGHFVEFVGGNSAVKSAIANAYNTEKSQYTASNKAYVLQNSSEYFAESFKNYCENPGALKQSRPNTYNAVVQALSVITDSRVNMIKSVYGAIWK